LEPEWAAMLKTDGARVCQRHTNKSIAISKYRHENAVAPRGNVEIKSLNLLKIENVCF
jgi:hypothetical protein